VTEQRSRVTTHLRSAQDWLSKAERSFDEQKDIRGELNLMLAQAELKRAQEEKSGAKHRLRYTWCRQGGALICAILLFGLGSLIWMSHAEKEADKTVTHVQTTQTVMPTTMVSAPSVSASTSAADKELVSAKVKTPYEEYDKAHRNVSAAILSEKEKEDLMKAAGRSLRGQ
jgi:hypothetical protein